MLFLLIFSQNIFPPREVNWLRIFVILYHICSIPFNITLYYPPLPSLHNIKRKENIFKIQHKIISGLHKVGPADLGRWWGGWVDHQQHSLTWPTLPVQISVEIELCHVAMLQELHLKSSVLTPRHLWLSRSHIMVQDQQPQSSLPEPRLLSGREWQQVVII